MGLIWQKRFFISFQKSPSRFQKNGMLKARRVAEKNAMLKERRLAEKNAMLKERRVAEKNAMLKERRVAEKSSMLKERRVAEKNGMLRGTPALRNRMYLLDVISLDLGLALRLCLSRA